MSKEVIITNNWTRKGYSTRHCDTYNLIVENDFNLTPEEVGNLLSRYDHFAIYADSLSDAQRSMKRNQEILDKAKKKGIIKYIR